MCVCFSHKTGTPSFTLAQEVDEVATSSGGANLEGFISLRGSRSKESTFFAYTHESRLQLRFYEQAHQYIC